MSRKSLIRLNKYTNYLLVEGKDDLHVCYSLLAHYKIPKQFEIENKDGIAKLLDDLEVETY